MVRLRAMVGIGHAMFWLGIDLWIGSKSRRE